MYQKPHKFYVNVITSLTVYCYFFLISILPLTLLTQCLLGPLHPTNAVGLSPCMRVSQPWSSMLQTLTLPAIRPIAVGIYTALPARRLWLISASYIWVMGISCGYMDQVGKNSFGRVIWAKLLSVRLFAHHTVVLSLMAPTRCPLLKRRWLYITRVIKIYCK